MKKIILSLLIFVFIGSIGFYSWVFQLPYSLTDEHLRTKEYVSLDEVSPLFIEALVTTEDRRFLYHKGMDPFAVLRATCKAVKHGHFTEGGSTITQQVAKNAFLTNERTFQRKWREFLIALHLEMRYSKDEILTYYINLIYFGDGAYGIAEASRHYFDKEPSALTLSEATLLAGLPQAPSAYAPTHHMKKALKRQQTVLNVLYRNRVISKHDYIQVIKERPYTVRTN